MGVERQPPKKLKLRTATVYLRGIRADVKAYFKAYCAKRGMSMTEMVEELMRRCIAEDNKLNMKGRTEFHET
jgi:antitoxin component of RelBE/YafQ-DinJ toxin-antitoxin module